jgi:hypothetical protein
MGTWTLCVFVQAFSFWLALGKPDRLRVEHQYWPTLVSAALAVLPLGVWALMALFMAFGDAITPLTDAIFMGRHWMHWVFVAIAGAQLIVVFPISHSEDAVGAVCFRAFSFAAAGFAWIAVFMFFGGR